MKSPYARAAALAGAVVLLFFVQPPTAPGQAGDDAAFVKLVDEVVAQQTEIVKNQAAMDEKIATVAEEVRQARLFVSRGGGKK